MDLVDFLRGAGYRRIELSRSGVGHFHAPATVAGRAVSALLDTGGSGTVLSLAIAREFGLPLVATELQGGGAGAAGMKLFVVEQAELQLGEVVPRLDRLVVMDLTHVNQALADTGEGPIELIIGVDVFAPHQAIIDYGSSSLFLQPEPATD
jgi:predicted aspartyl protease